MEILTIQSNTQNLRNVRVGKDVRIFSFVNAYDCTLGDGSKVGAFTEIQKQVVIGRNCKISSHCFICTGVELEDNVFVGHGVMFTNDLYPRATNEDGSLQTEDDWTLIKTLVKKGASIGSNATIICGITIGENAIIGAGAVVTKDVAAGATVIGNPAKEIKRRS
jgi:acetyltransferase-like isoleucine patch superfamily enzyme